MDPQNTPTKEAEKVVYKNTNNTYEEISEKRTSKLGYLLLILMVCFVIGVGETIFSDLSKIPKRPISPSYCISYTLQDISAYSYPNCPDYGGFNETDKKFELDALYGALLPKLSEIANLNDQVRNLNYEIDRLNRNIQDLSRNYDLGLQEKQAREAPIMNTAGIKTEIVTSRTRVPDIQLQIATLQQQKALIVVAVTDQVNDILGKYDAANEYYLTQSAWYEFKVFLLALAFVLPFFLFSLFYYLRFKKKNSPYTIIFTASTFAFSLLFLQVAGTFLYELLPKAWFARVFKFLLEIPVLRYIIYYGSVILIVGLFGGIVYYIQKKVFDPAKVAVRRLKEKKCPGCSFTLDSAHNYCPDCGLQLKENCASCGGLRVRYLAHCPNCGK